MDIDTGAFRNVRVLFAGHVCRSLFARMRTKGGQVINAIVRAANVGVSRIRGVFRCVGEIRQR